MARRKRFQTRHGRYRRVGNLLRRSEGSLENEQSMNEAFVREQAARLGVTTDQLFDALMLKQGDDARFTFEDVLAATDGTDIGLPPPSSSFLYIGPGTVEAAIFTDLADQEFFRAQNTIGVANKFTFRTNVFFPAPKPSDTSDSAVLFDIFAPGEGSPNKIILETTTLGDLRVGLQDETQASAYFALFDEADLIEDGYNELVLTRAGSALGLNVVYLNGAVLVPKSVIVENVLTMTDTSREMHFMHAAGGSNRFDGFSTESSYWDTALSAAEVAYLYAGTAGNSALGYVDLTQNHGDYENSASLIAHYPYGFTTTPGENAGPTGSGFDLTPTGISLIGTPLP